MPMGGDLSKGKKKKWTCPAKKQPVKRILKRKPEKMG